MKQLAIKRFVFLICVFLTIAAVIGCMLYNHKQNNKLENLKYNQTELLSSTISKNDKFKMDFYLSDGGSFDSRKLLKKQIRSRLFSQWRMYERRY